MTILVVDDQPQVVNGLIRGVNWKKCGIQKVLIAYNVSDAKKCIKNSHVDILLSDIEMPVENGFDLFYWIKSSQYRIECIFLTAHSDFEYVQKAIQMGSIDYILQPASYQTIEVSIVSAVDKVNHNMEVETYSTYKDIVLRNSDTLLHSLLADWVKGDYLTEDYFITDMNQLGLSFKPDTQFLCCYINCLDNENVDCVNTDIILNSIISEELVSIKTEYLLIPFDILHFALLFHTLSVDIGEVNKIQQQLIKVASVMKKDFDYDIGISTSDDFIPITEVPDCMKKLRTNRSVRDHEVPKIQSQNTKEADSELNFSYQYTTLTDIIQNLSHKKPSDFNSSILTHYYLDLMEILTFISSVKNCSTYDLFSMDPRLHDLLQMNTDPAKMKVIAEVMAEYLQDCMQDDTLQMNHQKQVETIKTYIRNNIEKDIRRNDIAKAVYLNPNYLSTMFKENMNLSLKEYITMEKMKLARTLLRTTQLPVNIIASKIGYSNFSHFSQTYKKMWGIPPTAERSI